MANVIIDALGMYRISELVCDLLWENCTYVKKIPKLDSTTLRRVT